MGSVWNLANIIVKLDRYAEAAALYRRAAAGFAANRDDAICRAHIGIAQQAAVKCERKAKRQARKAKGGGKKKGKKGRRKR